MWFCKSCITPVCVAFYHQVSDVLCCILKKGLCKFSYFHYWRHLALHCFITCFYCPTQFSSLCNKSNRSMCLSKIENTILVIKLGKRYLILLVYCNRLPIQKPKAIPSAKHCVWPVDWPSKSVEIISLALD